MMYYEFHAGEWATKISRILMEKQAAGVTVRLVVDEFGLRELPPFQVARNRRMIEELTTAGAQVHLFRPRQSRTSYFNRLHFKVCAIDGQTLFLGGSNIADDYMNMQDLNLRADGDLGPVFEELFEYLVQPSESSPNVTTDDPHPKSNLPGLFLDDFQLQLVLTFPGHRQDVRRSLLGLILAARKTIDISTWIFLPDREIVNALLHQIESGRHVHILLSDRTHVPFIDAANQVIIHRLVQAGAQVWRYAPEYMHAKACWNEQGTILFGSANLDSKALHSNYECSLLFKDPMIAEQLQAKFEQDVTRSYPITPDTFNSKHRSQKLWAYLSLLAAKWW
jgi:cardiolipin synthase